MRKRSKNPSTKDFVNLVFRSNQFLSQFSKSKDVFKSDTKKRESE